MKKRRVHQGIRESLLEKPRPGQFKAVCRKEEWRPFEALLDENGEFRGDLDALPNRWDNKRKATVFSVPCNFETTNRAAFEKHMTDVHGGSLYRWENGSLSTATWGTYVRTYSPLPREGRAMPETEFDHIGYAAPVVTTEEFRAFRGERRSPEFKQHMADTGVAPIRILGGSFLWACPGCGGCHMGDFGDVPVSGWEAPRWTREGDDQHLTLTPSLGCPDWRDGIRPEGHYWLRNGRLVTA